MVDTCKGAKKMKPEKKEAKKKLKNITKVSDFEELLEQVMLSEEEKQILRMIYKDQKTLDYVADTLGMSLRNVQHKHSKILLKVGKMF